MRLTGEPGERAYLLAAVVVGADRAEAVREVLRALRYRRQSRLHWRSEDDPRKAKIAVEIGALGLPATVVIGTPLAKARQERARGKCMEALLPPLEASGVDRVFLEARQQGLVRRDMRLVDACRSKGLITPGIRVEAAFPSEEPLLWLPDAVAGAVGAARTGQSEYLSLIGSVTLINVSTV